MRLMNKNKRSVLLILLLALCLLTACGKQKEKEASDEDVPEAPQVVEVKISTLDELLRYFDYKDYPSFATDEDGNITECNLSFGFSLKEGLTAANDPDHKDTLKVSFTADVLSQHGEFSIDFQHLSDNGIPQYEVLWINPDETVTATISETLPFWPQGNRTMTWQYGFLSSSYVTTIQSLSVTAVSGSIFLLSR